MKDYFKELKNKKFITSILCFMGIQALLYVLVKLLQTNYHVFGFEIDNKIPFIPQMIFIYNLFYPMVFISFYTIFIHDKDTYYKGILSGILGYIVADIIFLIYPVVLDRPDVFLTNADPLSKFIVDITYKLDTPAINCFPSIHCLFCFQCIYSLIKCRDLNKKYKVISIILLSLIAVSTVLVKNHYFIDIVGALVVCIITNLIGYFIYLKNKDTIFGIIK